MEYTESLRGDATRLLRDVLPEIESISNLVETDLNQAYRQTQELVGRIQPKMEEYEKTTKSFLFKAYFMSLKRVPKMDVSKERVRLTLDSVMNNLYIIANGLDDNSWDNSKLGAERIKNVDIPSEEHMPKLIKLVQDEISAVE